jgi:NAD(P)H-quinone oxidoreductase subunit 4
VAMERLKQPSAPMIRSLSLAPALLQAPALAAGD